MGSVKYYDVNDVDNMSESFIKFVRKHFRKNKLYGKRTLMIHCALANSVTAGRMDEVIDVLKDELIDIEQDFTRQRIVQLTHDFKGYVNFNSKTHEVEYEEAEEETLLKNLNDPDHPSNIVLFLNKGKCGMNVHNIKSYFSFRATDKKTDSGFIDGEVPILDSAIQTIGRMMRIWTGILNKDFVKNWGYDLTNYVKSLNSVERNNLLELNSYDVCVPDNQMWREAIRVIQSVLNPTKTQASDWIKKL